MVPVHSPEIILGSQVAFCSAEPWWWMASMAPWFSSSTSPKPILAACHISCTVAASSHGMPWPPNSGSKGREFQPPSTNSL